MIYERRHTRDMAEFGGLVENPARLCGSDEFMVLSSAGLPATMAS
jgi:NADH:ubiquinone oxidoreductase subunit 4 (subunit M)